MDTSGLSVWFLLFPIVLGTLYFFTKRKTLRLPPGPKPLPLLGNMFDMPTVREEITYAKWGQDYGDVVHVSVLGSNIIILNSFTAANELLDQRATIYSDRPYLPMLHEPTLMNAAFSFGFKRYTPEWKKQRRLFTYHMNPTTITQVFSSRQLKCTHLLLKQTIADPTELHRHLLHTAANIILGITYGYDVKTKNDPFSHLAEEVVETMVEGLSPRFLVNLFPLLRYIPSWMPGTSFKAFAAKTRPIVKRLLNEPFNWTMKQAESSQNAGLVQRSFVYKALNDSDSGVQESDVKEVAAVMYIGGVDTTLVVIRAFVLQMVLNPDIQRRAQAEFDKVLGKPDSPSFRLPTFQDRPNLPYMEALAKECIRWHPSAPTGVPHASMEEDEYRGWRIPKGSIIFPNVWGILRDEKLYSEPYKFNPDRFIGTKEKPAEPDPTVYGAFGFGKRACPGRLLAENSVWIQTASLIAAFDFRPAKDDNGNEIDVTFALKPLPGLVPTPPQFPCSITPRSKYVEEVINEALSHEV